MNLLITNDDGIYGAGIIELAVKLKEKDHNIFVVAPDRERSAIGHSITLHKPLRVTKVYLDKLKNIDCYKINGTPADCIKIGLEKLCKFKPDFIISGINNGPNLGFDVLYSGTVSAAIEGFMMGYNSIAVSLFTEKNANFRQAAGKIHEIIINLKNNCSEQNMLLNINIPDKNNLKNTPIKVTSLGKSIYKDFFEERIDPAGNKYYWLTGERNDFVKENTDLWAINSQYISLTPLKLNLTDKILTEKLNKCFS